MSEYQNQQIDKLIRTLQKSIKQIDFIEQLDKYVGGARDLSNAETANQVAQVKSVGETVAIEAAKGKKQMLPKRNPLLKTVKQEGLNVVLDETVNDGKAPVIQNVDDQPPTEGQKTMEIQKLVAELRSKPDKEDFNKGTLETIKTSLGTFKKDLSTMLTTLVEHRNDNSNAEILSANKSINDLGTKVDDLSSLLAVKTGGGNNAELKPLKYQL